MSKILLVEDSADTAEVVQLLLVDAGHEVVIATNEAEAFRDVIAARPWPRVCKFEGGKTSAVLVADQRRSCCNDAQIGGSVKTKIPSV